MRRGLATAEAAVCFPIVVLIALGSIEACSMIHLKQAVTIAAYEGARTGNAMGATTADVEDCCQQIFADRGINAGVVTTTPAEISDAAAGDFFTVSCSAPCGVNSLLPAWYYSASSQVQGNAAYVKKN